MFAPKALAGGVYVNADGSYWVRPWIRHRRTWRKLKAVKEREAFKEASRAKWATAGQFSELAQLYLDAGCPNARLEPASPETQEARRPVVAMLTAFFGKVPAAEISLAHLPGYATWRRRKCKKGSGERTVDLDLSLLSGILTYGVAAGQITANPIMRGRPRYRSAAEVRHSREVAPASADVVHQLADFFFSDLRSEVLGWQLLFASLTGCRTSELLRLRTDAATPDDPGFVSGNYLFLGRRSKGGVNPWALVGPELSACLAAHRYWHGQRFNQAHVYFPGKDGVHVVTAGALCHALRAACLALGLPHITPHGLRSFYVTKRRSDGVADTVIAGEIGDQTVSLMQSTYGARPANWTGGVALSWVPAERLPAWARWQPAEAKITQLYAQKR